MSADAPDHAALITQFTGLTGVAPHEVSSFTPTIEHLYNPFRALPTDITDRLSNISQQISGTYQVQLPSTTPPLKKPPKDRHPQWASPWQTNVLRAKQHLAVDEI